MTQHSALLLRMASSKPKEEQIAVEVTDISSSDGGTSIFSEAEEFDLQTAVTATDISSSDFGTSISSEAEEYELQCSGKVTDIITSDVGTLKSSEAEDFELQTAVEVTDISSSDVRTSESSETKEYELKIAGTFDPSSDCIEPAEIFNAGDLQQEITIAAGAGAVDNGELVAVILDLIDKTKKLTKKVVADRPKFTAMANLICELRPMMEYLLRDSIYLASQGAALRQIAEVIDSAFAFTESYVTGCRIYLLYRCDDLVQKMQRVVQQLKSSLELFSEFGPEEFTNILKDVIRMTEISSFQTNEGDQEIVLAIDTFGEKAVVDEAYSSDLLRQIAKQLRVPATGSKDLKEELEEALEEAEADNKVALLQDLRKLWAVVGQAVVLSTGIGVKLADEFPSHDLSTDSIPSAFYCPITGQVMKEPVMVVEAGYTYEKTAIVEWFQRGNRTCPDTGKELESLELLVNWNVRHAIEEFFDRSVKGKLLEAVKYLLTRRLRPNEYEAPVSAIQKQIDAGTKYKSYFVSIYGLEALVSVLRPAEQRAREKALRLLSKVACTGNENFKLRLIQTGVGTALVRLLTKTPTHMSGVIQLLWEISQMYEGKKSILAVKGGIYPIASAYSSCTLDRKEMAEKLLDNLCQKDPDVAVDLAKAGVFIPLVTRMAPEYDMDIRLMMVRAIDNLNLDDHNSLLLVESGVFPALLGILQGDNIHARVAALRALRHLTEFEQSRVTFARLGAVLILVNCLQTNDKKLRVEALGTLANLAADRQGAFEIDDDGGHVTLRLLVMVRNEESEVQEFALKTLVFMAKSSRMVRLAIKNSGDVPFLFILLQRPATLTSCRYAILNILGYLVEDNKCLDCVDVNSEVLQFFTKLLEQPAGPKEKHFAARFIAGVAANPETKGLMAQEHRLLNALVKCLAPQGGRIGSEKVQESVVEGLSRLVDMNPVDVKLQLMLAKLGMMPLLASLVNSKHDKIRQYAATTLGVLAKSTPQLVIHQTTSKRLLANIGIPKYKSCKVHPGRCSQKDTFCLVELGVVPSLVKLMQDGTNGSVESAIDALFILIVEPGKDHNCNDNKGVEILVKHNVIAAAVAVVGRTPSVGEKAVCLLERILRVKKYRDEKYSGVAKSILCTTMTTGTLEAKKAAARALGHMGVILHSSSYSM